MTAFSPCLVSQASVSFPVGSDAQASSVPMQLSSYALFVHLFISAQQLHIDEYRSTNGGVDSFLSTCCGSGVRPESASSLRSRWLHSHLSHATTRKAHMRRALLTQGELGHETWLAHLVV